MIKILDIKEVCKMLKVSRPTLATLNIPTIQVGKRFKYLLSDVEAFIELNKKPGQYMQLRSEQKTVEQKRIRDKISVYKKLYSRTNNG